MTIEAEYASWVSDDEQEERQRFVVDTEEKAAWAVDKLLTYQERAERLFRGYSVMLERHRAEQDRFIAYIMPQLEEYARKHAPRKCKTVHLMTGSIAFRTVRGGARITNPEETLTWAKANQPNLVITETKTTEKVWSDGVKSHVDSTGEIPPGVEITEDREACSVKPPKQKES